MWTSSSLCSSAVSHPSAHTASGRYYCNQLFVQLYLLAIYFNTVNGRYCCLSPLFYLLFVQVSNVWASSSLRSSAASHPSAHTASDRYCCNSTVLCSVPFASLHGFNTAGGRCCCNNLGLNNRGIYGAVSIPQAVSTVA